MSQATLPVDSITIAKNHRTSESVALLVPSIKERGVVQPIIVRYKAGAYELVCGERRLRAAKEAGLEIVPVHERVVADDQVLDEQATENLNRADITPFEEADTYQRLQESGRQLGAIAALAGRSIAHVARRLKLCGVAPKVRKEVEAGTLPLEIALMIARVPTQKLQLEALEAVVEEGQFSGHGDDWSAPSPRQVLDLIRDRYMLPLARAPFELASAELVPSAGPCTSCPKNSSVQTDLFGDVGDKAMCTDPSCYKSKDDAFWRREQAAAKKSGRRILAERETKDVFEQWADGDLRYNAPYVQPGDVCRQDPKSRTWKTLLGADAPQTVLARSPGGRTVELYDRTAAEAGAEKAGVTFHREYGASSSRATGAVDPARKQENAKRRAVEKAVPLIVLKLEEVFCAKAPGPSPCSRSCGARPSSPARVAPRSCSGTCARGRPATRPRPGPGARPACRSSRSPSTSTAAPATC